MEEYGDCVHIHPISWRRRIGLRVGVLGIVHLQSMVWIYFITAAGNFNSSQLGSSCQGNWYGMERQAVRPVYHLQNNNCRVTYLQPARRAVVLGEPSSLRPHWVLPPPRIFAQCSCLYPISCRPRIGFRASNQWLTYVVHKLHIFNTARMYLHEFASKYNAFLWHDLGEAVLNLLKLSTVGSLKGTVSRDFLLQVFFMNHLPPSPW